MNVRLIPWQLVVLAALAATPSGDARGGTVGESLNQPVVTAALRGYTQLARSAYEDALRSTERFRVAVRAFLDGPSRKSLEHARQAWIDCRDDYGRTEAFRFSGGPIDGVDAKTGENGPEGRINSWPVDEAYLDYVVGQPNGGLISDLTVPMTEKSLIGHNAADDDSQVTLGYHAIEFLLWGQDTSAVGPGDRPYTDYLRGDLIRERRRACLTIDTDLLVRDLAHVVGGWSAEPGHFPAAFLALDPAQALGHALSGPATLAGFELASERISIPLSSNSQEDEQSCFSDNTHRDIAADIEGLSLVLEGRDGIPGLLTAIETFDPERATDIRARLERARALAYAIVPPFDAVLRSPPSDPRRATLQALAGELIGLCGSIQGAAATKGIAVVIGGGS
jgi:putative iron-regulated protein